MVLVTDPVILSHLYPTEGGSTYNIGYASPPEKVSGEHYVYIPTSGWTLFTEDKIPEDTDYTRLIPKEEVENSETLYLALVKLCDEQITPRADYLPFLLDIGQDPLSLLLSVYDRYNYASPPDMHQICIAIDEDSKRSFKVWKLDGLIGLFKTSGQVISSYTGSEYDEEWYGERIITFFQQREFTFSARYPLPVIVTSVQDIYTWLSTAPSRQSVVDELSDALIPFWKTLAPMHKHALEVLTKCAGRMPRRIRPEGDWQYMVQYPEHPGMNMVVNNEEVKLYMPPKKFMHDEMTRPLSPGNKVSIAGLRQNGIFIVTAVGSNILTVQTGGKTPETFELPRFIFVMEEDEEPLTPPNGMQTFIQSENVEIDQNDHTYRTHDGLHVQIAQWRWISGYKYYICDAYSENELELIYAPMVYGGMLPEEMAAPAPAPPLPKKPASPKAHPLDNTGTDVTTAAIVTVGLFFCLTFLD